MTAPDLLPCPFCGGGIARTVGNASFSGVELMGAGTDRPYVWCGTCGSASSFEDSDHKAITAWNTRATLAKIKGEQAVSDAPERIWIEDERAEGGDVHVYTDLPELAQQFATSYTRTDLIQPMIDAASEAVWIELEDAIEQGWTFRKDHVHNAISRAFAKTKEGKL